MNAKLHPPRFLLLMLAVLIAGLPLIPAQAAEDFQADFANPVEEVYGADQWYSHDAFEADLEVNFGGNTILDGVMLMTPSTGGVRLEMKDGTVAVWDGEKAWVSNGEMPRARFHVLTWPYFLAVPFKLQDPGTHLSDEGMMTADDIEFEVGKLTFGEGVGDAPDDWYLVYKNPETQHVEHMAYIVTYGKGEEDIRKAEPHAISYDNFMEVDGVVIPLDWSFRGWSEETGPTNDQVGSVKIRNPRFVSPEPTDFDKPEGATEDKLPQ